MKLRDITEHIQLQGKITVKQWDEEKETYNILIETESNIFLEDILDMEVTFMYSIDGVGLMIEVE